MRRNDALDPRPDLDNASVGKIEFLRSALAERILRCCRDRYFLKGRDTMKRETTRILVESALAIAMATALSMFIIIQMPQGGSVTCASMAPLVVISFRHGLKWGALTAFAYGLLQMAILFYAPPAGTLLAFAAVVLLDYVLAFTVIGTAVFFGRPFKNRTAAVAFGAVVVCLFRLLCSFLSGILIWGSFAPEGTPRLDLLPDL